MLNLRTTVSAASGLAPDEVHLGCLPHLPLTVIERCGASGDQGLERDQIVYCDLAKDRQRLAYQSVREHDAIEVSRIARMNNALRIVFHRRPLNMTDCWVWVLNSKVAARQSISRDEDEHKRALQVGAVSEWHWPLQGPSCWTFRVCFRRTTCRRNSISAFWVAARPERPRH